MERSARQGDNHSGIGFSDDSGLLIYPERIDDRWWRQEGHLLRLEDIKR